MRRAIAAAKPKAGSVNPADRRVFTTIAEVSNMKWMNESDEGKDCRVGGFSMAQHLNPVIE